MNLPRREKQSAALSDLGRLVAVANLVGRFLPWCRCVFALYRSSPRRECRVGRNGGGDVCADARGAREKIPIGPSGDEPLRDRGSTLGSGQKAALCGCLFNALPIIFDPPQKALGDGPRRKPCPALVCLCARGAVPLVAA